MDGGLSSLKNILVKNSVLLSIVPSSNYFICSFHFISSKWSIEMSLDVLNSPPAEYLLSEMRNSFGCQLCKILIDVFFFAPSSMRAGI